MKAMKLLAAAAVMTGMAFAGTSTALAESTLDIVKKRGHLRCQVGQPSPGFYNLDKDGNWYGSDVAVCQTIAAAIFGDSSKVEYQSVSTPQRFTAMANGESDVLSRTTTWTLLRETQLGLVDSGIKSSLELEGATVCVATGTPTELNLADYSRANNLDIEPVTFEDKNVRNETFYKGGCDAVTNDKSGLASTKAEFPDPENFMILPETISKEPLGPVVRQGDSNWNDIVMWSVFALVAAEELGLNSGNVESVRSSTTNAEIKRMLGVEGNLHEGLGLSKDWAYNIVSQVGNYAEVYEAYMGGGERGIGITRAGSQNALWNQGGLMYSPPFR